MILFSFEFNIPKIKINKFSSYKTTTINFGFCKVILLNKEATDVFLFIGGLALTDFERVMRYADNEQKIEQLENQLAECRHLLNVNSVNI